MMRDRAAQYADAYLTYQEAADNITPNGAIVAHPRTGAPLVNPNLRIRNDAYRILRTFRLSSVGDLW